MRATMEMWSAWLKLPELVTAPRGDGHTVLVLPGFATSDSTTIVLRRYLRFLGYDPQPWGLGFNFGYDALGDEEVLAARLTHAFQAQQRKVSLVGWSLGGIMCRRLAREHPEMIRQVISLGSPFTGDPDAVAIRRIYELVSGEVVSSPKGRARFARDEQAPSIPSVAIWSRSDGITNWRNCCEGSAPHLRNIEIRGSHLGLTHNAEVLLAVARLLAEAPVERNRARRA